MECLEALHGILADKIAKPTARLVSLVGTLNDIICGLPSFGKSQFTLTVLPDCFIYSTDFESTYGARINCDQCLAQSNIGELPSKCTHLKVQFPFLLDLMSFTLFHK